MASPGRKPPDDSRSSRDSKPKMPSSSSSRKIQYVYQLPYAIHRKLCSIIDYNDKWKELGGTYLGFDMPTLYEFSGSYRGNNGGSPSEAMLSCWGQRDGSLDRLFVYLAHMDFAWAMRIILPYVSDKVKPLLHEPGVTTLMQDFQCSRQPPTRSRYPGESSDTSCFKMNPAKLLSEGPFYNSGARYSNASTLPQQEVTEDRYFGGDSRSYPPEYNKPHPEPHRTPNRVPVEETFPAPGANWSSAEWAQKHSETNNLDRFESKNAQSPNLGSLPHERRDSSAKIINVAEPLRKQSPPAEKHLAERPPIDKPHVFQIQPLPPRKLSNDSPRANEEEGSGPTRRTSDTPSLGYSSLPAVSFNEMREATHNFNTKVLGKGGFGTVYKGVWKNTKVAIKLIQKKDNPGVEALDAAKFKQSLVELQISDWCRHDNILPLYSYAINDEELCLVYQLMVNGSLEDRLQCRNNSEPLTWLRRCSILRGAACGIQFLHSFQTPLVHGDIKSANILLDQSLEAKVGDFGLVREGPPNQQTHCYVEYVNGTRAYLPHEYMRNRKLSTRVDTYSFGVVLFEVATGHRAYDEKRTRNKFLCEYVYDTEPEDLHQLKDEKAGNAGAELFDIFIEIGKECTQSFSSRPSMVKVFHKLEGHLHVEEQKNLARKASVTDYLKQKDLTPMQRQMLHDKKNEAAAAAACRPNTKEAKINREMANASDSTVKCRPLPIQNYRSPGRHATEQTVPICNTTSTCVKTPMHPVHVPICHAINVKADYGGNYLPPTYEDVMMERRFENTPLPPYTPYMPSPQLGVPPPVLGVPSSHVGVPSSHVGVPSAHAGVPSSHAGIPSSHTGVPSSRAGMLSPQPDVSTGNTGPVEVSASYLPDVSALGVNRVTVPIGNPQENSGVEQQISYANPPGTISLEASASVANDAVGGAENNQYPRPASFAPGAFYSQNDEVVNMFNSLRLIGNPKGSE